MDCTFATATGGRRRRRGAAATAAAACALLVGASPAPAAVSRLTDDPGAQEPDIAVASDGVSHVAWDQHTSGGDAILYCAVPRGATGCARTQPFQLPGPLASGPNVILMATGELVITWELLGINDADNRVFATTSTDGGATFTDPKIIGNRANSIFGWEGDVEAGPGNFSVSLLGNSGGANEGLNYSSAPLDAVTTDAAELTDDWRKAYSPSIGFVSPTEPIAAYSDLEHIFYRRWSGMGAYNDLGSWQLEQTTPFGGTEPRLASGPRGVYLMYADTQAPSDYWVSRFDTQANRFDEPVMVSADDGSSAIFRDFFEDRGGTLHAVFLERPAGSEWQLRQAVSPPGQGFQAPQTLATQADTSDNFYDLRVGAAPDGGGAVVADGNGKGPIYFVAFTASGGGDAACPPTVKLGIAVVHAQAGCFKKASGGRRVASGPVKVNGVDIEPVTGQARAAAAFKVTVDPKARTLKTSSTANVRVGDPTLDRGKVAWKLPSGTGAVQRIGAADPSVFKDLGTYAKKLFELPVDGDAELKIDTGERAHIPIHFQLPELIGGPSGAATLDTDASGLDPDLLNIEVPNANMGLLRVYDINVHYNGQNRFRGSARIELPLGFGPSFNVEFGFLDGRFDHLHYDAPFSPMLPIVPFPTVGVPPGPLVGLEHLGIDYVDEMGSHKFKGTAKIVGGGKYVGLRATELDGSVTLDFPNDAPSTIDARGDLSVVGIPFSTGGVFFSTLGIFKFDGSFAFPPAGKWQGIAGIEGGVDGWVSLGPQQRFSASGGASAHVGAISGSGDAVISSKGVSGCVHFPQLPPPADVIPDLGISYHWGDAVPVPVCNVSSFKLSPPSARAAANGSSVVVPDGLSQAAIEVAGAGGAPRVTVTAPDGSSVTSGAGPVANGRFIATEFAEAGKTYVSIGKPPAGVYTIDAVDGSVPITGARLAEGLPDPSANGSVRAKGDKRTLSYRIRPIAGQKVTFAEQSAGGLYHEFATVTKASGRITFEPIESRDRKRAIVAIVEQDGVPRARLNVAAFTAPKPVPLARPSARIRRSGKRLLVSWKNVRRAHGYRVRVDLPRDGRHELRFTGSRQRKLTLRGLEPDDIGRVTVQAIGADGQPGKGGTAKLKAQKRKRRG